jgi:2-hydroxychromene-2-carboxylate isomerase
MKAAGEIEFFFDCSSPWSYLAFRNIQPLAKRDHIDIVWRPVLVGGIFNAVNQRMYASREDMNSPRNRYALKDVQDCARQAGVTIEFPPKVFPVNSVKAMRGCLWLATQTDNEQKSRLLGFIEATFAAYFTRQADISQDEVLADICKETGIAPDAFMEGISAPQTKAQLKSHTDEAIARGTFGVPTFFVGNDMYFGNDRLHLAVAAGLALALTSELTPPAPT